MEVAFEEVLLEDSATLPEEKLFQVRFNSRERLDVGTVDFHDMDLVVTPLNDPHFGVLHSETGVGAVMLHFERDFKHGMIN